MERAQEKVAEGLRSLAGQSEDDAEVVCRALVERSGMLRETRPGYIDFIHNTFKEYLAAERFANSGDIGLLAEHASDPTWQRVTLFAVSTSRKGFAEDLIRRLLQVDDVPLLKKKARRSKLVHPGESTLRARQLLAIQCRASALLISPELERELDQIARALIPPRNMGDAQALAAMGDLVVPLLDYRRRLKAREAAACIRSLRLVGTPRALALLEGYREDHRASVVAELCQVFNPLILPAIRERLVAGESLSPGIRSQISDLSPLLELNDLKSLDLSGVPIGDISALSGLSGLQSLNLSWTQVSDISALSGLSSLQNLELIGTQVSDISALSGLSSLQNLELIGTQVSDISALSGLNSLQNLNLRETQVSDISTLSDLSGLQILDLQGTRVSNISTLSGLSGLQSLNLFGTRVSNISALSRLSGLQILDLTGTPLFDISALAGLSSLRYLDLAWTRVSDISVLSALNSLQRLDLTMTQVSDISSLSGLTSLRRLNLSGTRVSDISALSGLSGLQFLYLLDTPVSGVAALSGLSGLQIVGGPD
jgi:Leucine-rich repeat (LRR) protein